ncbi:MAG: ATP-binding protein [Gemmatimonadales bacterium]
MTFRTRLFLALAVGAMLPVLALGLAVRQRLVGRVAEEEERRVAAIADRVREALGGAHRELQRATGDVARQLEADNRVWLAARGNEAELSWLRNHLVDAMLLAGLDGLELYDPDGVVLASGQFRNDYGREGAAFVGSLSREGGAPTVAPIPLSTARPLGLVSLDTLALAGRVHALAGWRLLADVTPADTAVAPGIALSVTPGDSAPPETPIAASVPLRVISPVDGAESAGAIALHHDPAGVAALKRSVDRSLAGALVLALGTALALAAWLSSRLVRPVRQLALAAELVDLDQLHATFDVGRDDELGALAGTLAAMTGRLRSSVVRLREAERAAATGDLARQVNHDLKNGLGPIRNVLRHLAQVARDEPQALPAVFLEREPTLTRSLEYLEELSRDYARRNPVRTTGCDLNAVAEAVAAEHEGSPVRLQLARDLPRVRCDEVAARRILGNLVANAIESLDRTGSVTILTATAGGRVLCTVTDSGRGMSRAQLERAVAGSFTTKPSGSGTGIAVVRRLVEELGGAFRISTEPGRGTMVELALPTAPAAGGSE